MQRKKFMLCTMYCNVYIHIKMSIYRAFCSTLFSGPSGGTKPMWVWKSGRPTINFMTLTLWTFWGTLNNTVSWSYSMSCKGYRVSRFGTPYKHKLYMSMAYFIPCPLSSKFLKTFVHFVQSLLDINEEIFGFADLTREFSKNLWRKKLFPKYKTCTVPIKIPLFVSFYETWIAFCKYAY